MVKIFIDGAEGTTGLVIRDRLKDYKGIEIITLPEELRKDVQSRTQAMNSADLVFLCLPDAAAKEAVTFITNPNTVVIDTSTAHRTNDEWAYGFPELTGRREKIKSSKRIANPGCHASGFIALVAPLIEKGVIDNKTCVSAFSITGYTGGGKKMIAEYENDLPALYHAPRQYGITQQHKHLKEMVKICGIENAPIFCPIVAPYYCGMEVTVPLFKKDIKGEVNNIKEIYKEYYKNGLVKFSESEESGFLSANLMAGRDDMLVGVYGNEDRFTLVARFDNLGKGASGAALQNMNIMLGVKEDTGLIVED